MSTLNADALTTLLTVYGELGFTVGADPARDGRYCRYINSISREFAETCNRQFFRSVDFVEKLDVPGHGNLRLVVNKHRPIESITSIEFIDGTTTTLIDATEYEIEEANRGWIRRLDGFWQSTDVGRQGIVRRLSPAEQLLLWVVTYTGGYVTPEQQEDSRDALGVAQLVRTLPDNIEEEVIDRVVTRGANRGRNAAITSKKVSRASVTYATASSSDRAGDLPGSWRRAVGRHKRNKVF